MVVMSVARSRLCRARERDTVGVQRFAEAVTFLAGRFPGRCPQPHLSSFLFREAGFVGISPRPTPPEDLLHRVREKYRETPNLRLTPSQAQRFFELEPFMCVAILEALLKENFLFRTSDGVFVRSAMPK